MPAPGAGAFAPAGAAQPSTGEASPLGLFDALLQIATTFGAGTTTDATATGADQQTALGAILEQQIAATIDTSTTLDAQPADVLGDLLGQLTVLADALDSGAPVDGSLEAEIGATLETLAATLGLAPPATPDIDADAIATVAVANASAALDPLAAISAAIPAPAGESLDIAALPAPVASDAAGGNTGAAALLAKVTGPTAADAPALSAATAADAEGQLSQPETVKALVGKIVELADQLRTLSPALAEKLDVLSRQIGSGEIDIAALARIGEGEDAGIPDTELAAAINRLLHPAPVEVKQPAPALFTAAALPLPEIAGLSQGKMPDRTPRLATPDAPAPDAADEAGESRGIADTHGKSQAERPDGGHPQRPGLGVAQQAHAAVNSGPDAPPNSSAPAAPGLQVAAAVAADTRAIHAAYKAPVQQINIPQIAFEIVRQVEAGASRFQIRLDPPELGRVDVKLDVDKAGNVTARMTVERAETLDLMQRDQRSLERALAQAGLDSNKTNLEFSLRQNPFARDEQQQRGNGGGEAFPRFGLADNDEPAAPQPHILAYRGMASAGGVNLFV